MACRHYYIAGQVQGVFFRASTYDKARSLCLTGWVRNIPDGRVEAVACGDEEQLTLLEGWFNQGPPMSKVDTVDIVGETEIHVNSFEIRY
ncbi:MAG: acylphosphatase [Gammaproteobacteria bacterium]|nr:acylphosphatase [Gammaproteobacteria bacterium]